MRVRPARRASTLLAVGLTAAVLALPAGAALAAPGPAETTDPGEAAAGHLARVLEANGHFLTATFGGTAYPDIGLTIDAVLGLDAAGVAQTEAAAATGYVADDLATYVGDGTTEAYAGATAKALLLALAQQQDPTAFGGVDLVTRLEGLAQPSGRYQDTSAFGDYSNVIGQSLAIIALDRAGSPAPAQATTWLVGQQCPDGGFDGDLTDATCTGDTDMTAFAVQAVLVAGGQDASAADALDFLVAQQDPTSGAVTGGQGPNANTTGLVAQAFAAAGLDDEAALARGWLLSMFAGADFAEGVRGVVALNPTRLEELRTATASSESDQRATAQAVLGLTLVPFAEVTNEGATDNAPVLAVPPTPTTPPTSPTATPTTSTSASAAAPVRTGGGDELAATGAASQQGALVASGLVALGAVLVLSARRGAARGLHL